MWNGIIRSCVTCELSSCLPVLAPHARHGFRFILHVCAVIIEQRLIFGRLLCGQFEFIASGTVLGLWLCRWLLLRCRRLQWFLLRKRLLLLRVARAGDARLFFFEPRRWMGGWATDWSVWVYVYMEQWVGGWLGEGVRNDNKMMNK